MKRQQELNKARVNTLRRRELKQTRNFHERTEASGAIWQEEIPALSKTFRSEEATVALLSNSGEEAELHTPSCRKVQSQGRLQADGVGYPEILTVRDPCSCAKKKVKRREEASSISDIYYDFQQHRIKAVNFTQTHRTLVISSVRSERLLELQAEPGAMLVVSMAHPCLQSYSFASLRASWRKTYV